VFPYEAQHDFRTPELETKDGHGADCGECSFCTPPFGSLFKRISWDSDVFCMTSLPFSSHCNNFDMSHVNNFATDLLNESCYTVTKWNYWMSNY
jgi:hypothetical protein